MKNSFKENRKTEILTDKFQNMMDLYNDWADGRSSNLSKLKFKIDSIYGLFSKEEKVKFTHVIIEHGKLTEKTVKSIELISGHITSLTG